MSLLFTGLLFGAFGKIISRFPLEQHLFRQEWQEDLFYYFVSSLMVQSLSFLALWPSQQIVAHTHWGQFRTIGCFAAFDHSISRNYAAY